MKHVFRCLKLIKCLCLAQFLHLSPLHLMPSSDKHCSTQTRYTSTCMENLSCIVILVKLCLFFLFLQKCTYSLRPQTNLKIHKYLFTISPSSVCFNDLGRRHTTGLARVVILKLPATEMGWMSCLGGQINHHPTHKYANPSV